MITEFGRKLKFLIQSVATYYRFGGLVEAIAGTLRLLSYKSSSRIRARRWEEYLEAHPGVPRVHINGCDFILDRADVGISAELAIDGVHEPHATAMLLKSIEPGMTIVDAGSNLGYYAIQESAAVGESGKIIAIEPNPATFDLLTRNIETICGAISNESGSSDPSP